MLYPSLVWRKKTTEKVIYLTFDDGPVPGPTDFVLETLRSFNVTGTFFCIGNNVNRHHSVFKKIITSGHAIGNHTYDHVNGWKTKPAAYLRDVQLCGETMRHQGFSGDLFRPPFGRISRSQIGLLKDYRIVMWDVLTFDYDRTLPPGKILRGSLLAARPGSIVVFHDSLKAEPNLRYVLPGFIKEMLSRGYTFRPLE